MSTSLKTTEDHANAALIIAAPDLLEALESVTANLAASMTEPMRRKIDAAITKALGSTLPRAATATA